MLGAAIVGKETQRMQKKIKKLKKKWLQKVGEGLKDNKHKSKPIQGFTLSKQENLISQ
jgi:hypothetical protein